MADFSAMIISIGMASLKGVITILFLVFIGGIAFFIWRQSQYKFTIVLFKKRADGKTEIVIDKGGFFKTWKGEAEVFRLRKNKAIIKPIPNKHIEPKSIILMRYIGENQYFPFSILFNEGKENQLIMDIDYDENMSWYLSTMDLLREAFSLKNWMARNWQYISAVLVIFMTIIAIALVLQFATDVGTTIGGNAAATNRLAEAITNLFNHTL